MSPLHSIATGRDDSLFAPILAARKDDVLAKVEGKRILAIGAAGSIGSSTTQLLAKYSPAALHVVDQNENALAEYVRQFWSMEVPPKIDDLRLLPLDYGSEAMHALLESEAPYDIVLNFAAIKHVRSEKDRFSLLQMFDTNIVKQVRLMRWLSKHTPAARYFSVSTDKAANPVSFMGSTKRVMEHILFAPNYSNAFENGVTSARFANVAFSNGSILQSFQNRLARNEPLAAPDGIRRYFVSLAESGEICTLASLFLEHQHIGVPDLDPEKHLVLITDVARNFLKHSGYEAVEYTDSAEAVRAVKSDAARGRWPLIISKADTAGEKPYEEFVADGEVCKDIGLAPLKAVPWAGLENEEKLYDLVKTFEEIILGKRPTPQGKDELKHLLGTVEPAFLEGHIESTANLDQRA